VTAASGLSCPCYVRPCDLNDLWHRQADKHRQAERASNARRIEVVVTTALGIRKQLTAVYKMELQMKHLKP